VKITMEKTLESSTQVTLDHIINLVKFFQSNSYSSASHNETHEEILEVVQRMWAMDYSCMSIDNTGGVLCASYPKTIFVPDRCMITPLRQEGVRTFSVSERTPNSEVLDIVPKLTNLNHDAALSGILAMHQGSDDESPLCFEGIDASETLKRSQELQTLVESSKYGRSRNRFVVPVILYNGKYIARSSTVPLAREVLARMGIDILSSAVTTLYQSLSTFSLPTLSFLKETSGVEESVVQENLDFFSKHKAADAALLKKYKISTIFDLMVEEQKVKFYLYCSSSEKVKGETFYEDFTLNIVPYPGCEFFRKFTDRAFNATDLKFDWNQAEINAELKLQEDMFPGCNTTAYKNWDLRRLTRRYLQYMLTYMKSDQHDGMLVHCISGWDRTPLFVSLLRISLWADGVLHQSLDAAQMLYFTLANDWMFFSHQLADREKKSETVMVFCFYFLKYIKGEQFNVNS
ncbi:Tyrosine/serine-protein phosphatase IphP-type, partial [Trinorchestia longiramus]